MRRSSHRVAVAATVLSCITVAAIGSGVRAAGSGPEPRDTQTQSQTQTQAETPKPYDRGMELVRNEEYAEARRIFEQLSDEQPKNAEVLNMLAYTQRKTGDLDEAIGNYHRALALKPKFPQAREYLGEAYLQAALREAETLRGYGGDGKEDLAKLVSAFHEAASQLDGSGAGGSKSGGGW